MMMNCPKCGFSQPSDQYCARCGVDMTTYKPEVKPLAVRLLGSTVVQAIALVVVVVTVFTMMRQQRRREIAERVAEIENAQNTAIVKRRVDPALSKTELASTTPTETAADSANEAPPVAAIDASSTASGASAPSQPAALVAGAGANPAAPATSPTPANPADANAAAGAATNARPASSLRVVFAAAQRVLVSDLLASSDGRYPTSGGPLYYGIVPNFQAKLRQAQSEGRMKILDTSSRSIDAGQPASLNNGQRDEATGQMLGFDIETLPAQLTATESQLQMRLLRYLRDGAGQVEEFSVPLPDTLTIPKGAGVFIAGVLPRRGVSEQDRRVYEPFKILHILTTDEFRAAATDLIILIEPR